MAGKNASRRIAHFPWNSLIWQGCSRFPRVRGLDDPEGVFFVQGFFPVRPLGSAYGGSPTFPCSLACVLLSSSSRFWRAHLLAARSLLFRLSISFAHHGLASWPGLDHGIVVSMAKASSTSETERRVLPIAVTSGVTWSMIASNLFRSVLWCSRLGENWGGSMDRVVVIRAWSESPPLFASHDQLLHRSRRSPDTKVRSGIVGRLLLDHGKVGQISGFV